MQRNNQTKRPGRSIARRLAQPLSLVMAGLLLCMSMVIFYGGVVTLLRENAAEILTRQVQNRQAYLQNYMVGQWSDLGYTVDCINSAVEQLRDEQGLELAALERDPAAYSEVLLRAGDELIEAMRTNAVTGAFLVLCTEPIEPDAPRDLKGLYLRDLDPTSRASTDNADLLIKRGPVAVTQQLGIATDSDWQPLFSNANGYPDAFLRPYQAAADDPALTWDEAGCWSAPLRLKNDNYDALTYSVPLRLEDGTLYGVLGVDLTFRYLEKLLPYEELVQGAGGAYMLAYTTDGQTFTPAMVSGHLPVAAQTRTTAGNVRGLILLETEASDSRFGSIAYLNLYDGNTPFAQERWALLGMAEGDTLFAAANRMQVTMLSVALALLCAGIAAVGAITQRVARPIVRLTHELDKANAGERLRFSETGILEIDRLTDQIEALSADVLSAGEKFAQIMRMASIRIGGFEVNHKTGTLFVTEEFFGVFGWDDISAHNMSLRDFQRTFDRLSGMCESKQKLSPEMGEVVFCLTDKPQTAYVRLRYLCRENVVVGLAEDITATRLEMRKLEHERDHDLLTGLLSRRAFRRLAEALFEQPAQLGVAALLMFDLDNLKRVNDTYGHDYGDRYIRGMADGLREAMPAGALLCRQSGDEMFALLYGYESERQLRNVITEAQKILGRHVLSVPGGVIPISASGGIAWYPRDSRDLDELGRYADFAMYEVKRSRKGELNDFDAASYRTASQMEACRAQFEQLLREGRLLYHWQPIVDARTGKLFAYEGLMRSELELLRDPQTILDMAQRMNRMNEIEQLTLFCAMGSFVAHCREGRIPAGCKAFINSIPNQLLNEADAVRFETQFADYLPRMVVEITENEQMGDGVMQEKRRWNRKWNSAFALDDYGSGYNSESVLLSVAPEYVKIDMTLVRDIDTDRDKQKIVQNLLSYTSERGILVIAEGVETRHELCTLVRMGVDLLQGYFIARPAEIPPAVPDEVVQLLRRLHAADGD